MKKTNCNCSTPGYPCSIHNMVSLRSADGSSLKMYTMQKLGRNECDLEEGSQCSAVSSAGSIHQHQSYLCELMEQPSDKEVIRCESTGSNNLAKREVPSRIRLPRPNAVQVQFCSPQELEINWTSKRSTPNTFASYDAASSCYSPRFPFPCNECRQTYQGMSACEKLPLQQHPCPEDGWWRPPGAPVIDSLASVRSCQLDFYNDGTSVVESRMEDTTLYRPENLAASAISAPWFSGLQAPEYTSLPNDAASKSQCEGKAMICCKCKQKMTDEERAKDTCSSVENLDAVLQQTIKGLNEAVGVLQKASETARKIGLPPDPQDLNRALNEQLESNVKYVKELKNKMRGFLKELESILASEPTHASQLNSLLKELELKPGTDADAVKKEDDAADSAKGTAQDDPGVKTEAASEVEPGDRTELDVEPEVKSDD